MSRARFPYTGIADAVTATRALPAGYAVRWDAKGHLFDVRRHGQRIARIERVRSGRFRILGNAAEYLDLPYAAIDAAGLGLRREGA